MGLWRQMKAGKGTATDESVSANVLGEKERAGTDSRIPADMATGKLLVNRGANRIAELWSEVEGAGGSVAWEWILRGSNKGIQILQAEDRVNAAARRGDCAALASACDAWVSAWHNGIEGWKASQKWR